MSGLMFLVVVPLTVVMAVGASKALLSALLRVSGLDRPGSTENH